MHEVTTQLVNDAHRQNIAREVQHERNIREAQLARQDDKRERKFRSLFQPKPARKTEE